MLKTVRGFKDFIMRGNVIDLSVGIVIGAAFTALVTAVTKSLVEPLIRVFSGGEQFSGLWTVNKATFDWAASVNALITFVDHRSGALLPRGHADEQAGRAPPRGRGTGVEGAERGAPGAARDPGRAARQRFGLRRDAGDARAAAYDTVISWSSSPSSLPSRMETKKTSMV